MNKKLLYIFIFLVIGSFVISACNLIKQEEVGAKVKGDIAEDDRVPIVLANITYYLNISINPISQISEARVRGYYTNGRRIWPDFWGRDLVGYSKNTRILLTAISSRNWTFGNWSEDATGNNENITITMNSNKTIVANFRRR